MCRPRVALLSSLIILSYTCYAQEQPDKAATVLNFPSRLFSRIQNKTLNLNDQLTHQTEKYLQRMQRREQLMYRKLYKVDSVGAKALFAGSSDRYAALSQKLASDTGGTGAHLSGEYQPYTDSLQGMLKFASGLQGGQVPGILQGATNSATKM